MNDISGKLLEKTVNAGTNYLDISTYSKGIYILTVKNLSTEELQTFKIVKQ